MRLFGLRVFFLGFLVFLLSALPLLVGLLPRLGFLRAIILDGRDDLGLGGGGIQGEAGRAGFAVRVGSTRGYGGHLQRIDLIGSQRAGMRGQGGGIDHPGIQRVVAGIQQLDPVFRHVAIGLPGHGQDVAGNVAHAVANLLHVIKADGRLTDACGALRLRVGRIGGFAGFGFLGRHFVCRNLGGFLRGLLGDDLVHRGIRFLFSRLFGERFGDQRLILGHILFIVVVLDLHHDLRLGGRLEGGHGLQILLGDVQFLFYFQLLGFLDGFRGRFGGRLRRGIGLGQLDFRQGEQGRAGAGGLSVAALRDGEHGDGVDLAGVHGGRADAGLEFGHILVDDHVAALVLDRHLIDAHIALGRPEEGDRAGQQVVHAVFDAGDGIHADFGNAHGVNGHVLFLLDGVKPDEFHLGAGDVFAVAVLGVGRDPQRVDHVEVQRDEGNAGAGHQGVVVGVNIAHGIADADVVVVHRAFGVPVEHDVAIGRAGFGDEVDAIIHVIVILDVDVGGADDGGLHVFGGIVGEQQHLGAHGGDAGGLQSDLLLEQGNGFLGFPAEVPVHGTAVVVQRLQATLQAGDALVVIAAAQHDVAGRFGSVVGEQQALHGLAGVAGFPQARRALEHTHRRSGLGGIGAAGAAFQVIQVLQAVVQLAHAVAGVAGIEVDVAGAMLGPVGVQPLQRIAGGRLGFLKAVLLLEQLYRL